MKNYISLVIALACTLSVFAQPPQGRGMGKHKGHFEQQKGGGDRQKRMADELNLTDGQKQQMKSMNESFRQKMKALNDNENITVRQQRDERYNLMKQHRENMQNLLTAEQREKAKNMRAEQQQKMQAAQAKGFEKMAEQLKLTENQKSQFARAQEKQRSSMQAIMQNDKLDRSQRENQLQAIREEHKNEIARILTKEQQRQLDQWKQQRPTNMQGRPGFGPHRGHGRGEGPRQFI
jgi:Spy/CpxP family protein refolding chaperone